MIFPFVTYSFSYAQPSVLVNVGNHAHLNVIFYLK